MILRSQKIIKRKEEVHSTIVHLGRRNGFEWNPLFDRAQIDQSHPRDCS